MADGVPTRDLTDSYKPRRGRPPKKTEDGNPNVGNGRDPRQHIQVISGQAAAGRTMDFFHNNGTKTAITPQLGRHILAKLNSLKPVQKQEAVNKIHYSADGLREEVE